MELEIKQIEHLSNIVSSCQLKPGDFFLYTSRSTGDIDTLMMVFNPPKPGCCRSKTPCIEIKTGQYREISVDSKVTEITKVFIEYIVSMTNY